MNKLLLYQAEIIKELLAIEASTKDVKIIRSINAIADTLINVYSDTDNYLVADFQDYIYGRLEELGGNNKNSEWTRAVEKRLVHELNDIVDMQQNNSIQDKNC